MMPRVGNDFLFYKEFGEFARGSMRKVKGLLHLPRLLQYIWLEVETNYVVSSLPVRYILLDSGQPCSQMSSGGLCAQTKNSVSLASKGAGEASH